MGETAMKFGPKWLRALSVGNTSSPPSSPGPGKFRLAECRYGREEMLGLYSKNQQPPDDSHILSSILYSPETLKPLAYIPMDPEEQRGWQRCVNSDGVMRGTGRGSTNCIGRGRGSAVERGRGTGRVSSATPYYSRGISYEEEIDTRNPQREGGPPGLGGRNKLYERSQSANDGRSWAVRHPPNLPEDGVPPQSPSREQNRSTNINNWRSRKDEDRWRGASENGRNEKWGQPRSAWRGKDMNGDWDESKSNAGIHRSKQWEEKDPSRKTWEDDKLPEWAIGNNHEKEGSFDATGNFHAPGYSDDESQEYQEKENHSNETFERSRVSNSPEETKPNHKIPGHDEDNQDGFTNTYSASTNPVVNGLPPQDTLMVDNKHMSTERFDTKLVNGEDENLHHMRIVVAKLVEDEDERSTNPMVNQIPVVSTPSGFIPQQKLAQEEQWFYTDPQGEVQGPFSSVDMASWYKAGYFQSDLLLRRQCDDKFAQLGHLTKVFGRVPFLPGPIVPPLKVSELQKALAERERHEYQVQNHLQQQQAQLRQQQVLQYLQNIDGWNNFTNNQKHQMMMQHALNMSQPPVVPAALQTSANNSSVTSLSGSMAATPSIPNNINMPRNVVHQPPSVPQSTDAIQAFLARINHPNANAPVTNVTHEMPASVATNSNVMGDGPLEKLLMQLQRNSAIPNVVNGPAVNPPNGQLSLRENMGYNLGQPDSVDPIQSLMNQFKVKDHKAGTLYHKPDTLINEEEQQRIAEMNKLKEEQIKNELRLREERQKEEEKRKKLEEKNQQLQLELEKVHRQNKQKEEMLQEQKRQEELKRIELQAEEAKKKELHKEELRLIEQKKLEASRKKEEMKQKQFMEEEKRKKEVKKKKEDKINKINDEPKTHKKEEEKAKANKVDEHINLPTANEVSSKPKFIAPVWNSQLANDSIASPSLAEIQKTQELKDKKEKEAETQKELKRLKEQQKKLNEEKKHKELNMKWAAKLNTNSKKSGSDVSQQPPVKSLLEIQREEEKALQKQLQKEQTDRTNSVSHMQLGQPCAWGSGNVSWANKASSVSPLSSSQTSWTSGSPPAWSAIASTTNASVDQISGFWDNPKMSKTQSVSPKTQQSSQSQPKSSVAASTKSSKKKAKDDNDNTKKGQKEPQTALDRFNAWNTKTLSDLTQTTYVDIPTFTTFLAQVESPDEVSDYIKSYLGDSKQVKEYTKQYLERRSKVRATRRNCDDGDDILGPAPAINPGSNLEFQEVKPSKVKKNKKKL